MKWLWQWVAAALALLVVAGLFHNMWFDSIGAAFVAALVLGVVNAVIKPFLHLISLPVTILTFGLFALVINAAMLELVAHLVHGFHIYGFGTAFFGSIVLTIVGSLLQGMLEHD